MGATATPNTTSNVGEATPSTNKWQNKMMPYDMLSGNNYPVGNMFSGYGGKIMKLSIVSFMYERKYLIFHYVLNNHYNSIMKKVDPIFHEDQLPTQCIRENRGV